MVSPKNIPADVAAVYDKHYSKEDRIILLELRTLILDTAKTDERIGPLTETLKWGEPAFLTDATKSGSTLRLGVSKLSNSPAMFVSCSTPLLNSLKKLDKDGVLTYHGLRDIAVPAITKQNRPMLETCILKTLTYHLDKNKKKKTGTTVTTSSKKKKRCADTNAASQPRLSRKTRQRKV